MALKLSKCEIETKIHWIADVADHAAKMSVEEHMQSTTIENLQKDLDSGLYIGKNFFHIDFHHTLTLVLWSFGLGIVVHFWTFILS